MSNDINYVENGDVELETIDVPRTLSATACWLSVSIASRGYVHATRTREPGDSPLSQGPLSQKSME